MSYLYKSILGKMQMEFEEGRYLKAVVLTRGYQEILQVRNTNHFFRKKVLRFRKRAKNLIGYIGKSIIVTVRGIIFSPRTWDQVEPAVLPKGLPYGGKVCWQTILIEPFIKSLPIGNVVLAALSLCFGS